MKNCFLPISILFLLLLVALPACMNTGPLTPSGTIVEIPSTTHTDLIRLSDGELLVKTDNWTFYSLTERHFVEAELPDNPACTRRTKYLFPLGLSDGRLGLLQRCSGRWPDRVSGKDDADYIVAYDWESRTLEKMVHKPLPAVYRFSWNPEMTRGVLAIGYLTGTIAWITPEGLTPMTVTVGTENKSWSLDENFETFGVLYKNDFGIARKPSWSHDGEVIAFFASTSVIGKSGHARARGIYSLYLLDPVTLALDSILDNVRDPLSPVWSPDSNWLLFQGHMKGKYGLWLISRDGTAIEQIDKGQMTAWNWIDNNEIIAIYCLDDSWPCEQTQLVKYDVNEIIVSAQP